MTDKSSSNAGDDAAPKHTETKGNIAEAVGGKTRRGIQWSFIGAVITNAVRIVVLAVLGRALTKDDFGIVAAAVSVYVLVFTVRDLGIGIALVQRKELLPGHVATAFATSTYLGLALSSALFVAAPWIGRAYGIVESTDVIRGLAGMFAIRSVATTSRMLCQRAMNFRLITLVEIVAFTIGSGVAIASALAGAGPWALVAGYLTEEVISAGCYLVASPPKFSLRINRQRLRELLDFGGGYSVVLVANLVATFGDNFIVGRTLGAAQLGFYSRAYDLMRYPSMVFDAVVGNVLFPAFSRLQQDPADVASSFRRVTFVNALLLLPASAALIVVAPEAIRIVLGQGWNEAVLPFQILVTAMLLRTSMKLASIVAQALGAVNSVAVAQCLYAIILVGGAVGTVRWGIVGVATSTSIAIAIASFHACYLALRVARLSWRDFLTAHVPGLGLTVLAVATAWPLTIALRSIHLPAGVTFALGAIVSVAACIAGVAIATRSGRGDFAWLGGELRRARSRLARSSSP